MAIAKTDLERKLYTALKMITLYQNPDRLRRISEREYGLPANEAIEMAYENVLAEAKHAIKGVRVAPKARGEAVSS